MSTDIKRHRCVRCGIDVATANVACGDCRAVDGYTCRTLTTPRGQTR